MSVDLKRTKKSSSKKNVGDQPLEETSKTETQSTASEVERSETRSTKSDNQKSNNKSTKKRKGKVVTPSTDPEATLTSCNSTEETVVSTLPTVVNAQKPDVSPEPIVEATVPNPKKKKTAANPIPPRVSPPKRKTAQKDLAPTPSRTFNVLVDKIIPQDSSPPLKAENFDNLEFQGLGPIETAKKVFEVIHATTNGPSSYILSIQEKTEGKPPKVFVYKGVKSQSTTQGTFVVSVKSHIIPKEEKVVKDVPKSTKSTSKKAIAVATSPKKTATVKGSQKKVTSSKVDAKKTTTTKAAPKKAKVVAVDLARSPKKKVATPKKATQTKPAATKKTRSTK